MKSANISPGFNSPILEVVLDLDTDKLVDFVYEIKKKDNMQRYIFSLENINAGQKINLKNISFKRSNFKKNNALKAEMFNKFKNYRIRKKIKKDTLIKTFHF